MAVVEGEMVEQINPSLHCRSQPLPFLCLHLFPADLGSTSRLSSSLSLTESTLPVGLWK